MEPNEGLAEKAAGGLLGRRELVVRLVVRLDMCPAAHC